jgi:hypothetical protein
VKKTEVILEGLEFKRVSMMKIEDEVLPQLFIHIIDEIPARAFVRRLAEGEAYQSWKIEIIPFVFRKK